MSRAYNVLTVGEKGVSNVTEEQDRLTRIEGHIDKLNGKVGAVSSCLVKTNGDIGKLDEKMSGRFEVVEQKFLGLEDRFEQKFVRLEDKIDQIVVNTSKKEENKLKLYIAIIAAVVGASIGALARFI
ncbi:MAG: hypothetical protein PHO15_09020 [Eubacteriales bacterium]|nr:hypothetical protein [Eubacteriales bacterium]